MPTYALITEGRVLEVKVAQSLDIASDSVVVIDRGYVDYELFSRWTDRRVWFVTQLNENADYEVIDEREPILNRDILCFVGTSQNTLKIQIWTALIGMLLIKYLQFRSRIKWSLSNLIALLRWNLFTYRHLWDWINDPYETPPQGPSFKQLSLNFSGFGQHK